MGFLWRRRSSLVKIVILLSAVWFTVAFLIYSEDRRDGDGPSGVGSGGSGSGGGIGQQQPHNNFQALPLRSGGNNEIDDADNGNDMNGLESVINNVIMSGDVKALQPGGGDGGINKRDAVADVANNEVAGVDDGKCYTRLKLIIIFQMS